MTFWTVVAAAIVAIILCGIVEGIIFGGIKYSKMKKEYDEYVHSVDKPKEDSDETHIRLAQ